jgi:hypothetical protein
MANCIVSGTFTNPQGAAISGATVRFNLQKPALDVSGNLLMPKEITTTTASDGTWSLSIVQSTQGNLTLDLNPTSNSPVVRYNFSLSIPATATATFASVWVDSSNFAGGSGPTPLTFANISGQLATSQLPALASTDIWVGDASGAAAAVVMSGDGSLSNTGALTVTSVGTSSAANIHTAEVLANAATDLNTPSTIMKRDASGQVAATTFTGALAGNAATATTATNFSGSLVGDVTGTQVTTRVAAIQGVNVANTTPTDSQIQVYNSSQTRYNPVSISSDVSITNAGVATVATVGGSSASNIHSAELLANAATNLNTVSTIVKRDGSGNFSAGTITASLTGTASGNTTYSANNHGVVVSSGTNAMTVVAPDASTSKVLVSGGSSADPSWSLLTNSNLSGSAAISNANLATMTSSSTTVGTVKGNISGSSSTPSDVVLTSANTSSSVVYRDASGNFSAGTITASLSGNASTVTTNANLTGDVTSSGNATTYSGTVPLNKGGTGQTTKAAAFDALSPMSASGDIIYGGASGTGTRLVKGSDGQVLTLASGVPTWAPGASSTGGYWSGYFTGSGTNYWSTTSSSYGNWTLPASIPTLNELKNSGFGTVTIAGASNNQPGLHFTAQRSGLIMIHFSPFINATAGENVSLQLWESGTSTIINECGGSISSKVSAPCFGMFSVTASTVYNIYLRGKITGGTANIGAAGSIDSQLSMSMFYLT